MDRLFEMKELAEKKEGKCLSTEYINAKTKLEWECKEGHIWKATPDSIKHGSWCNICSSKKAGIKRRLGIGEMQKLAHGKGGRCLSTEYLNNMTKLQFECRNGHKWMATPDKIKSGKWCPHCAGNAKGNIEELQQLAILKGGKCLSNEYINSTTKLFWECGNGHTWWAIPHSIKRGHWCPHCNHLINESKTRFILSYILGKDFPRRRDVFEENYELDGYNEELKLAFEYNGIQHYKFCKKFHRTERDLLDQQVRDTERKRLCLEEGIDLLIVPYYVNNSDQELIEFILNELKTRKYKIINENVKFDDFYINLPELTELKQMAKELGGKLLSNFYIDVDTKLDWECKEGHKFKMIPSNVKKGHWCSICSGKKGLEKRKKTLSIDDRERFEKIKQTAISKGGKCLSEEYKGVDYKLKFICAKGHIWETQAKLITKGAWCKKCSSKEQNADKRVGIQYFKELALERGGVCLTDKYENIYQKLTFECNEGHVFEALGMNVKNKKTWCPKCAAKNISENKKVGIQYFKELALERGGVCLTKEYIKAEQKLSFMCRNGHTFSATGNKLRHRGKWCNECEQIDNPFSFGSNEDKLLELQKLAGEKGGKCLSGEYVNNHDKLEWQCMHRHTWLAEPSAIKGTKNRKGTWCPVCSNHQKDSIENMFILAEKNSGKCLSEIYVNARTKLKWQCKEGHVWEALPNNVKRGSWCKICSRKKAEVINGR